MSDAARLRTNLTRRQIEKKIDNLIERLNLKECEHNLAGGVFLSGISGGERKRTALGIELITDPHLILLDEPTSGLDSENSY
jgi:ABC-type multidrug transport system ATPase subunit